MTQEHKPDRSAEYEGTIMGPMTIGDWLITLAFLALWLVALPLTILGWLIWAVVLRSQDSQDSQDRKGRNRKHPNYRRSPL